MGRAEKCGCSVCSDPPRMLRMVPLGDLHMNDSLNSATRASSGVIVALRGQDRHGANNKLKTMSFSPID